MKVEKKVVKPKTNVKYIKIAMDDVNQRIDNFLISRLKGLPRSRLYRLIRKGEIRVNKRRIAASYRLLAGDEVRLPPIQLEEQAKKIPPSNETTTLLSKRILYEDDAFLIINKPSGMSCHSGNTIRMGIVEALRFVNPNIKQLELAHRLDAETSGCLILAKKKRVLRDLHNLFREGQITKIYWALTEGKWKSEELRVDLPLHKTFRKGEKHVVSVNPLGKSAITEFKPLREFKKASLVEVKLFTGRTHQIRVHATHMGHPIAGDERYGNNEFNKKLREFGLKRMFLHAYSLDFVLPSLDKHIRVEAPLDPELKICLDALAKD